MMETQFDATRDLTALILNVRVTLVHDARATMTTTA